MTSARPTRSPLTLLAALALVVAACAGDADPSAPPTSPSVVPSEGASASPTADATAAGATYRIGVSNSVVDDPWHEAMICSIRAQAGASGRVDALRVADRITDADGQAADIRNLVATGVDAIVLHPSDPAGISDAVTEALGAGVTVVSVGRALDIEGVYSIATDQEAFGFAGATWLFETLEGEGEVMVMRRAADDPVDSERKAGIDRAAEAFPDIAIVSETETQGDPTVAVQQINEILASDQDLDGIWTSGIDTVVIDAFKAASERPIPIAGGDSNSFVSMLLTEEGLVGTGVTDPPAVGGAGLAMALQILDGRTPSEPVVRIAPEVWPNDTEAGVAALTAANDPDVELGWPLSLTIPGFTTYTLDELIACTGPGP